MTTIDLVLGFLILFGAIGGYRNGFLLTLISLSAIILGVLAGFKLMGWAMLVLVRNFRLDDDVLPFIAFGVVFLIVIVAVNILGGIIRAVVYKSFLGGFDQVAGGVLGALKTTFMISVVLWIIDSVQISFPDHWTNDSILYPFVAQVAPTLTLWIGKLIPALGNIFDL